ncbi:MAG: hypothetical protein KGS61_17950 [Verrucomicrobia bacterium]|nr:hypothetical protein [Verrucomicrobiota bacterium]
MNKRLHRFASHQGSSPALAPRRRRRLVSGACCAAFLALLALPIPAVGAGARESVLLRNGDLLYGMLDAIDPQTGIRWRRPDVAEPIDLEAEAVAEIQFPLRAASETRLTNACRVHLVNQDEFQAGLVAINANRLEVKTWYAGSLTLARTNVDWIQPLATGPALIYAGPTGLDGWTVGKVTAPALESGTWHYRNGAFYAIQAASIARDLHLPPTASVQFDLAWKGAPHLAIAIDTDYLQPVRLQARDLEPDFGEFYSLMLTFSMADVLVVDKHDPLRSLGQVYVHAFDQKTSAHIEIRASKPRHSVALLVDGALIKQWVDPQSFAGDGTAMRFVHQGSGAAKLSNLRVTEWDGQLDENPTRPAALQEDLTRLRNGDKVAGRVESLRADKLAVANPTTPLTIPWSRIKLIQLAQTNPGVAHAPPPGAVRAFFSDGGHITVRIDKWDAAGVAVSSPLFGKARFDPLAFDRLQFLGP